MKNIYTYMPEKNYKRLTGLQTILICVAIGLFAVTMLMPDMSYRWIFQLGGLLALGAEIFIFTRYIMKKTVYALVEDESGRVDFTVTEITNKGRSQVTVCRFDVQNIEKLDLIDKSKSEDKARGKELSKQARREHRASFNYCPDMLSSPVCYIFAQEGLGPFFIKAAPDDYMYNYLKSVVDRRTTE